MTTLYTPNTGTFLLRMTVFTSSGTWTKQADVGAVQVIVQSGGASPSAQGGATSFGSYLNSPATVAGTFPVGTNGDINLQGGNAKFGAFGGGGGAGGRSFFGGGYGAGSTGSVDGTTAGGYSGPCGIKVIHESLLTPTVPITVGAAAAGAQPGVVVIYEYMKGLV